MAFFITKKQKKLMRERRRKIHKSTTDQEAGESTQEENARVRNDAQENPQAIGKLAATIQNPVHKQSGIVKIVVVPSKLESAQDKKKFRKEIRRKARAAGEDPDQIHFKEEGDCSTVSDGKRDNNKNEKNSPSKKRTFPNINQLVKEEKKAQEENAKRQKFAEAEASLSEEYKRKYVALDCEMVGIGSSGKKSVLARVSLVDWYGATVLDTFVQVPTRVTDFRTWVSGVQPKHLKKDAMDVAKCRETVAEIIREKVVVGHALKNDFSALMLSHAETRDTAKYRPFQRYGGNKWRPRKLRDLVRENLDLPNFQADSHDSVQDAKATMELFKKVREEWERELDLVKIKRSKLSK